MDERAARRDAARERAAGVLRAAGIAVTPDEERGIEVTDFGLGRPEQSGLQLLILVNDARYCAKEMVLFPGQTCPEHLHPPFEGTPGKQETLRVRAGTVYLYLPGEPDTRSGRASLSGGALHGLARARAGPRRPAHDPADDQALVPRTRRGHRVRVLDPEPRRVRPLHGPRDRPRGGSRAADRSGWVQPSGTAFFGSRNGMAAVRAAQRPPSGASISTGVPGPESPIGIQT